MPPTKGVAIRIGDKSRQRRLRFDNAAFERLQDETACTQWPDGMPLMEVARQVQGFVVKTINTCVWVGLLHAEPDLEREQVVRMIDSRDMVDVVRAVSEAITQALPKRDANEAPAEGNDNAAT